MHETAKLTSVAPLASNGVGSATNGGVGAAAPMRHAVIRRHQSMYIHPRATTEIQPTSGGKTNSGNNAQQHYKLQVKGL